MRKILAATIVAGALATGGVALATGTASAAATCKHDPNKIEYSDSARIAAKQYKRWCRFGLIASDGGWTLKGRTWIDLRNGDTPKARTTKAVNAQLGKYRRLGLWNPNKIEYADSATHALAQFKSWYVKGYISLDGGWTKRGLAQFD